MVKEEYIGVQRMTMPQISGRESTVTNNSSSRIEISIDER